MSTMQVESLVSLEIAEMQKWTAEIAAVAVKRVKSLLDIAAVRGDHRLQLEHALALLTEAVEFLGPVEIIEADTLPSAAAA